VKVFSDVAAYNERSGTRHVRNVVDEAVKLRSPGGL
jgi:hypothetical protein